MGHHLKALLLILWSHDNPVVGVSVYVVKRFTVLTVLESQFCTVSVVCLLLIILTIIIVRRFVAC
jgi:uncharacterized membrane protein